MARAPTTAPDRNTSSTLVAKAALGLCMVRATVSVVIRLRLVGGERGENHILIIRGPTLRHDRLGAWRSGGVIGLASNEIAAEDGQSHERGECYAFSKAGIQQAQAPEGARPLPFHPLGHTGIKPGRRLEFLRGAKRNHNAGEFLHLANFGPAFCARLQMCRQFPWARSTGEVLLKPIQNHLMHTFLPL